MSLVQVSLSLWLINEKFDFFLNLNKTLLDQNSNKTNIVDQLEIFKNNPPPNYMNHVQVINYNAYPYYSHALQQNPSLAGQPQPNSYFQMPPQSQHQSMYYQSYPYQETYYQTAGFSNYMHTQQYPHYMPKNYPVSYLQSANEDPANNNNLAAVSFQQYSPPERFWNVQPQYGYRYIESNYQYITPTAPKQHFSQQPYYFNNNNQPYQ